MANQTRQANKRGMTGRRAPGRTAGARKGAAGRTGVRTRRGTGARGAAKRPSASPKGRGRGDTSVRKTRPAPSARRSAARTGRARSAARVAIAANRVGRKTTSRPGGRATPTPAGRREYQAQYTTGEAFEGGREPRESRRNIDQQAQMGGDNEQFEAERRDADGGVRSDARRHDVEGRASGGGRRARSEKGREEPAAQS